ncbi:MAG: cyclic nucleotide-binding domain-containing protein, partial [Desulfobacteraceae bacterium]|nr:cyclic nucleotide-binding domain-containing protein [Desulfobacteraceae bacterium]
MKKRKYNAGDIILKEGDPSDVVYEIVSGDVEVFKEHDGQIIILGVMKTGEFLGEMGIVGDEPRSASARAKNQVSTIIYEEEEFFRLISRDSTSVERLILRLCERVRILSRKIAEATVSLKTADAIGDERQLGELESLPVRANPICRKAVIGNKCFIHSPAEKRPELCNQALAVSDDQAVVFRCGIIDKTEMYEADSR